MAINVFAELNAPVDWGQLSRFVCEYEPELEFFPIPAAGVNERDALGIQVPLNRCGPTAQAKLQTLLRHLWARHDAVVVNLYEGSIVSQVTLPALLEMIAA
jgi:hypothetical protein